MPPVINVHTHYQPGSVLPIIEPYGITMVAGPDGSWQFRFGDIEYNIPGTPETFWGTGLGNQIPEMDAAGIDINVRRLGREDNVVLGSNYPGWDNAPIWETIRALPGLSDRAKQKILGENAADRLFHARP